MPAFVHIFLFAGLVIHKLVWELLKRSAPREKVPKVGEQSIFKKLLKLAKVCILLFLIAQTLFLPTIFPIVTDPLLIGSIGLIIYTIGLIIAIIGRVLGTNWANIEDYQVLSEQQVVQSGIYRYIRHPIYVGDIVLILGLELALNSWLVLGVLPLIIYVNHQAKAEEIVLVKALTEYAAYQKRTKMFIPFVY
jgi:protein-S-isoprenylcysteine O-methyltransferase Ste14